MNGIYKRGFLLIIAISAAITLLYMPVFSFQGDKGIMSNRTYEMDQRNFYVYQTDFENHETVEMDRISLWGLYYPNLLMIAASVLCFLSFFSDKWRIRFSIITVVLAGIYYAFMIYYAVKISNKWYPTLYPNLAAILPAVVLESMVLMRKSLLRDIRHGDEKFNY